MTGLVKMSEDCRCGGSFTVEDHDRAHAADALLQWREAHRCMPVDETDLRRTGVGFAATETVAPPEQGRGHNNLDVTASMPPGLAALVGGSTA